MQILKRAALIGAAAMAMGALPAVAQTVTFTTAGTFTGASCVANVCTGLSGWTIAFNNGSGNVSAPSGIDLGQFSVACPTASCAINTIAGTTFQLTINQTNPSLGSGSISGSILGNIGYNPDNSTLTWRPTTSSVTIGSVVYTLVTDNFGQCSGIVGNCINIASPNSGTNGANPNTTVVKGFAVVPEPSTVGLMATGLFGLVPVAFRRRRRR
jgi:hypothetical protein